MLDYLSLAFLLFALTNALGLSGPESETLLRQELFKHYDPLNVPPANANSTYLSVGFELYLYELLTLVIIVANAFSFAACLLQTAFLFQEESTETIMKWVDERLKWNPADWVDASGRSIDRMFVERASVWLPPISSANRVEVINEDTTPLPMLFSSGLVSWENFIVVKNNCKFNVQHFPFDTQSCNLLFTMAGAYVLPYERVRFTLPAYKPLNYFQGDLEWTVEKFEPSLLRFRDPDDPQDDASAVGANLVMKRQSAYYNLTQVLPIALIVTLALVGLFCPSNYKHEREEKISIGLTALLTVGILMMTIVGSMPKTSDNFPSLGIFLITELFVCVLWTLVAVGLGYLHSMSAFQDQPPQWLLTVTMLDSPIEAKEDMQKERKTPELSAIHRAVLELSQALASQRSAEAGDVLWKRACSRLDVLALATSVLTNTTLCIVYSMGGQ